MVLSSNCLQLGKFCLVKTVLMWGFDRDCRDQLNSEQIPPCTLVLCGPDTSCMISGRGTKRRRGRKKSLVTLNRILLLCQYPGRADQMVAVLAPSHSLKFCTSNPHMARFAFGLVLCDHWGSPSGVEECLWVTGRAGMDGKSSIATLLLQQYRLYFLQRQSHPFRGKFSVQVGPTPFYLKTQCSSFITNLKWALSMSLHLRLVAGPISCHYSMFHLWIGWSDIHST